jgi:hypothetical protein
MLSPAKTPPRAAPALVERSASTGRNPFARDARRTRLPRRAAVAGGGMLFALGVFTFLAWIQPDTNGERVETPIFRPAFKVERDPPPKTQQPERERRQKPPPKPREQKAKPKKVARTSKPRTAQRSTTSRTPRSSVPQVSGNVSLGVGTGGGGPVISVGGGEMDAALDEMAEVLERDRIADQIREREFTADEESRSERNTPGVVKFRALIELDGTISEYSILDAQPPGFFEETVDEHVIPEMRFDPALDADGNPMPAWTVKTYRFQLKDY